MSLKSTKPLLTILFSSLLVFGYAQEDKYKQISDSLNQANKYEELISLFTKELKLHPKNEELLRSLGHSHLTQGNTELCKKYYLEALSVNPNCGNCYAHIGAAYLAEENYDKANEYLEKGILIAPKNSYLYSNRAKLNEAQGSKLKALQNFDKAIAIAPSDYSGYIYRGDFNLRNGYTSLALADNNKAIALAPDNYLGYYNRSHVYFEQQNFNAAINDIEKAIELNENNASLYLSRGAVYAALNQRQKAIADYTTSIALNKDVITPYYNRALSHYSLENLDASCTDLRSIETKFFKDQNINPSIIKEVRGKLSNYCDQSKPSYYYQRGVGYYNLKQFDKAISIYTEGLTHFPNNSMMLSFKANTYYMLKEFTKAIEYYDLALKNKKNYIDEIKKNANFIDMPENEKELWSLAAINALYLSKSKSYYHLDDYDKALTSINKALEFHEKLSHLIDFSPYYFQRGNIHLIQKRYELAFNDFDSSLTINGNVHKTYIHAVIADISLLEDINVTNIEKGIDTEKQAFKISWLHNKSKLSSDSQMSLENGIRACNIVLSYDENNGFAYYIRGKIKLLLQQEDYCEDVQKAFELNIEVENKMLTKCKK